MYDLLRSYKMILKRKNSIDSDVSQPLVSSQSSTASFGAFQDQCMFHNSDSTECEIEKSTKPLNQIQSTPKQLLRRPFSYPGAYDLPNFDLFATNDESYEKRQFFAKLPGILSDTSFLSSAYLPFTFDKLEAIKTQNSLVTIFAVWNTIMGSSLLAMAWGFERSGLISGIILHLGIAGICLYTAQLILSTSKSHGVAGKITEVPDLCRELLGKWAEIVARIFSLIVLIGANIVYWILMSNFLYNFVEFLYEYVTLPEKPDNRTILCPKQDNLEISLRNSSVLDLTKASYFYEIWNLHKTVPLFLALLMFPLLNFKSPTFFTKFNSLGTLSGLYMVAFAFFKAYSWGGIHNVDWLEEMNFKPSFSALSGMLALSYFIHNIIISVMRSNRNQERNVRDLSVAYALVVFTYLFVGVAVYACFPLAKSCIEDNILNNFPKYDPLTIGARVLLLFQLFTVFPLMAFMLRLDIFNNFKAIFTETKCTELSHFRVVVLNATLVVVCVLFACFLPKIGTLIRYTGALSGMVYVFTLPSLLKMAALKSEKALTPLKTVVYVFIVVLGVLNFCSQFFIADG